MPQYIKGYVAASLRGVGDLDAPMMPGTNYDDLQRKFNDAEKQIEEKVKSVPLQDRLWRQCIVKKDSEPVIVLGVVYEEGQTPTPRIPAALAEIFQGETEVQLQLAYP